MSKIMFITVPKKIKEICKVSAFQLQIIVFLVGIVPKTKGGAADHKIQFQSPVYTRHNSNQSIKYLNLHECN